MSEWADLHIHTTYSDSTSSPEEVVQQACDAGLKCIAITDHDTVDGVAPTMELGKPHGLEIIAGVEMSCRANDKDVHVLGYLFDYTNQELVTSLKTMQGSRVERMQEMIDKLKGLGIENITLEEVREKAQAKALGRPHLAATLMEKGCVTSIKEAFDRYLADGQPAFVSYFKQTPQEAITLIKNAGGIAVLAHPMLTKVDELIPEMVGAGLGGLEAYYPNCPKNVIEAYVELAKKHDLFVTGGSDAHGEKKKNTYIGKMKIPYEMVETLKQAVGV